MSQDFYSSGYSMGDPYGDPYGTQQPGAQQQVPYSSPHQFGYNPAAVSPQQPMYTSTPADPYNQSTESQGYTTPTQHSQGYGTPNQSSSGGDFYNSSGYYNPNMGGSMGQMGTAPVQGVSDSFEDEPPLMEELGIDLQQIYQTTMTVLNPSKPAATTLMDDPDLAGPLLFCLAFGSLLLLSGKIHFGYIYGVALIGALAMYTLLNLMSVNGVSASITVSVLGYCMLPMCALALTAAVLSLKGTVGIVLCITTCSWAAFSSSKLFVSVLAMYDQQPLVAYPCAIMYGLFAVLTVF